MAVNQSNSDHLMDQSSQLYNYIWDNLETVTLYNIIFWGFVAIWLPVYVLQPFIIMLAKQV